MTRAAGPALLLWRGELRVQGMTGRHRVLVVLEGLACLGVLLLMTSHVRSMLLAGSTSTSNLALMTTALCAVVVVNVLVLGEQSRTRVGDLLDWAAPLPLRAVERTQLLVLSGLLRSVLFAVVLVGGVAAGALSTLDDPLRMLLVLLAALVLPLLPVAVGLRLGARRSEPLPSVALAVPVGAALTAALVRLPGAPAPVHELVELVATPARALLGLAQPATSALLLLVWLLAAGWAVAGLAQPADAPLHTRRPTAAGRLAVSSPDDPQALARDLVGHRTTSLHLLTCAASGAALGLVVLLVAVAEPAQPVLLALVASLLAVAAVAAGYGHVVPVTTLPLDARDWLRSAPVPERELVRAAHRVRTAAALCATSALALSTTAVAVVAGLGPATWPVVLWIAVSALSLGGWVGRALAASGLRRLLLAHVLLSLAGLRAAVVTAVALSAGPSTALLSLVVLELLIGGAGQCLLLSPRRRP